MGAHYVEDQAVAKKRNYPAQKLVFISLKTCYYMNFMTISITFEAVTDKNPLTVLTTALAMEIE